MRPVAQIAQSVEQGIENPRVGGSIPSLGTINTEKPLRRKAQGFFIGRRLTIPLGYSKRMRFNSAH
jgi:hypothetical protein